MKEIYTIGHSVHSLHTFLKLLQKHTINTIVDVRSIPYSKFASQYNRESLANYLKQKSIYYIYMGDALGAKYEDEALLFDNGSVDFSKVQKTEIFKEGIARLEKGIDKGYTIALMCSEAEVFDCHRFGLISQYLSKTLKDVEIKHIYPHKKLSHQVLETLLIKKYTKKIDYLSISTDKTILEQAYIFRNKDIGYQSKDAKNPKE